mmetsp:Transcript_14000/g.27867  ORF Transcript_14000/g.27867 Transcript_14000/m.27867 type:complete len:102 (-) Transcript_14000:26-331(-)
MGWSKQDTDRALLPVLEQLSKVRSDDQTRLDSFFLAYHDGAKVAAIRSERLGDAVRGRTGKPVPSSFMVPHTAAAAPPASVSSPPPPERPEADEGEGGKEM